MKKQLTKKLLISFMLLSVISSSFALLATTKARSIRASLDPSYKYTLNNQSILADQPTIVYRGRIYAPIDAISGALGYDVNIRNNQVAITTPSGVTPMPPKPAPESVTIPRAEILGINFGNNTITILPAGKPNKLENQIILRITDQTSITDGKTKKAYSINDLTTGIPVKVVHSAAMTFSIPPQTQAISITLL